MLMKQLRRLEITVNQEFTKFMEHIFCIFIVSRCHVWWDRCHYGVARPQVTNGGKASRYGR
jgi:hypothetical protein